jgi:hypothetical protein
MQKVSPISWKNNYMHVSIIKLLINKQAPIDNFKIKCFVKIHWNKTGNIKTKTMSQKWAIQPSIHPLF